MQRLPTLLLAACLAAPSCVGSAPAWRPAESVLSRVPPAAPEPPPPSSGSPFLSPQGVVIPWQPRSYGETSVEGRPLHYWVLGDGEDTTLILGGIHGNERTSSELAFHFLRWIADHPAELRGKRLVIAPLVNPDGYQRDRRENALGVDLNRNYPATNWSPHAANRFHRPGLHPRSEPETRFVLYLMSRYPPGRTVSVHGAAACVNWDGPAELLARQMASILGLPARPNIGYPTPGSFGSLVGSDWQVPTITLELPDNRELEESLEPYHAALLAAMHYPGASRSAAP